MGMQKWKGIKLSIRFCTAASILHSTAAQGLHCQAHIKTSETTAAPQSRKSLQSPLNSNMHYTSKHKLKQASQTESHQSCFPNLTVTVTVCCWLPAALRRMQVCLQYAGSLEVQPRAAQSSPLSWNVLELQKCLEILAVCLPVILQQSSQLHNGLHRLHCVGVDSNIFTIFTFIQTIQKV